MDGSGLRSCERCVAVTVSATTETEANNTMFQFHDVKETPKFPSL
jgi:hypothetical protein